MSWEITGNAGTNPAANFLGTTDGQPLVIRTNALERMRITPDGQAWFKGMLRIDSGHITTNVPNGALVLNAGPPDATNVAGIWFRKTTVLGDPSAYTDLMRITADGNVVIGTTPPGPGAKLTVDGSISVTALGTYSNIEFTGHPIEISTGYSSDDFNLFMGADRTNQLSYIQSGHHNIGKATLALNPQGGNVGIGTTSSSARLSVVGPNAVEIIGTARSATLLTSGGGIGNPIGSEQALASFGLLVDGGNSVSLGVRAVRTSVGVGWPTTAIGLGMDVDNTVRAGAALFLHANGNVGIGTSQPDAKLTVAGQIHNTTGGIKFPDGSIQTTATLRGPQGPQGPQGRQGPQGPAVHTSAVCGPVTCDVACNNRVKFWQAGDCAITSDTGSCRAPAGEFCCVCSP